MSVNIMSNLYAPPTVKILIGHLAFALFIFSSMCLFSILYLVYKMSQKVFELGL